MSYIATGKLEYQSYKGKNPDKRQTIMPDGFRNLARDFKVTLPEKFLYEK